MTKCKSCDKDVLDEILTTCPNGHKICNDCSAGNTNLCPICQAKLV